MNLFNFGVSWCNNSLHILIQFGGTIWVPFLAFKVNLGGYRGAYITFSHNRRYKSFHLRQEPMPWYLNGLRVRLERNLHKVF
jgi:hypothetical protein